MTLWLWNVLIGNTYHFMDTKTILIKGTTVCPPTVDDIQNKPGPTNKAQAKYDELQLDSESLSSNSSGLTFSQAHFHYSA